MPLTPAHSVGCATSWPTAPLTTASIADTAHVIAGVAAAVVVLMITLPAAPVTIDPASLDATVSARAVALTRAACP